MLADRPAVPAAPDHIRVYLDGSLSMAGYAKAQTAELRPQGDLLTLIGDQPSSATADYFQFGAEIHTLAAGKAAQFATPKPYQCGGAGPCDNRESRIDLVLQDIREHGQGALNVVVTDLWLSSGAVIGSPQVALGAPLAELLAKGQAVGVLGLRAPYEGPIYDLPGGLKYSGARERPLFVLLIGPQAQVSAFKAQLTHSGSPAFSTQRAQFSLFALATDAAWKAGAATPLTVRGVGLAEAAVLPPPTLGRLRQYVLSIADAKAGHGALEGQFDAGGPVSEGLVWSGPLKASTAVWVLKSTKALVRCPTDAWAPYASPKGAWRADPQAGADHARLTLDATTAGAFTPGRTYLVAATLGSRALTQPNPAADWMRAWSLAPGEAEAFTRGAPSFFKVLNLGDLAQIMEQSLQTAAPRGQNTISTAVLVKVER